MHGIPAELLKYSGGVGITLLKHLLNAILATRRIPSTWRTGIVVHLPKGGDTGDCSNYRPLTLLPVIDKLFATLISARVIRAVSLHDHQYAFRPGRGTLNPLHNMLTVVRQRTAAGQLTFACFFDAAKAYDSVPHDLLLHSLIQKGVTGTAFEVIRSMYSSARSQVRVGGAVSSSFPIRRGVAQGCPLSPLLYAIFIDSVLHDMQAVSHPGLLRVGPPGHGRQFVGQAYADDLAGLAGTEDGLQHVIRAVHAHSLQWGWTLNVPKSVVVVFGAPSVRAHLGCPKLLWGTQQLPTAATAKYLGLRLESAGTWGEQQAAATSKGWAALHKWLPVLRSARLSASTKLLVLRSRITPCMLYAMELWRPERRCASMDAVIERAAKLISGIRADASCTAFSRDRSINRAVMFTDLDLLSAHEYCRIAHARQYVRASAGADRASTLQRHDPCVGEYECELPAATSPDFMGAATLLGLGPRDKWLLHAQSSHDTARRQLLQHEQTPRPGGPRSRPLDPQSRMSSKDIREGLSWLALSDRGLVRPTQGLHGRRRCARLHKRSRGDMDVRNPSTRLHCWHPASRSLYTSASSAVVHPIMSLRSSHLPHDHLVSFGSAAITSSCLLCGGRVFPSCPDFGSAPSNRARREHRWRHIEHLLFTCPCVSCSDGSLAVGVLRKDIAVACAGCTQAEHVLQAAFPNDCISVDVASACLVPFLLDPAGALGRHPPSAVKHHCLRLVAAFLLGVSCVVCTREPLPAPVLRGLCLPDWSALKSWLRFVAHPLIAAPVVVPPPAPVLHLSAPTSRGAVADARLGSA